MKAKHLIDILKKVDPETTVVLSSDSEGNSYYPVSGSWVGMYNREEAEVGLAELTEELKKQGYTDEDVMQGEKAIILYP